jgi:hypothetical protein
MKGSLDASQGLLGSLAVSEPRFLHLKVNMKAARSSEMSVPYRKFKHI